MSSMTDPTFYDQLWLLRDINTPCSGCSGLGVRAYGNTSTWRHGIGGQAITGDVCDNCWGSGDEERKGVDLRSLYNRLQEQERELKALREERN